MEKAIIRALGLNVSDVEKVLSNSDMRSLRMAARALFHAKPGSSTRKGSLLRIVRLLSCRVESMPKDAFLNAMVSLSVQEKERLEG